MWLSDSLAASADLCSAKRTIIHASDAAWHNKSTGRRGWKQTPGRPRFKLWGAYCVSRLGWPRITTAGFELARCEGPRVPPKV